MKTRFARSPVLALLLTLPLITVALPARGQEVEITGTVRDVDGTRVTIPVPDGPLPAVGDPVALSQQVPGVGSVPVEGEWIVTDVGIDFVVASARGEAARPQPGQSATIHTTTPRRRVIVETERELLEAASSGSPAGIHAALGEGADVNVRGLMGSTPLMNACGGGHAEAVRMLLEQGADVTIEAFGGQTALGVAAAQGHTEIVALLLEAGADPDTAITSDHASDDMRGATPLILAARFGHAGPVARLLAAGADPNVRTPAGMTALMYSTQSDDPAIIEALLDAGADPNVGRPDGVTPLFAASAGGATDAVRVLVNLGADIEQALPDSVPEPYAGMTPLLAAASEGQVDVVVFLLSAGANVQARNLAGQDAFALASTGGHDAVIEALRDPRGAMNRARAELAGELLEAAEDGDLAAVRRLLRAGVDPDTVSEEEGATPIMLAASENEVEVVRALIEAGANVDAAARGDDGEGAGFTALMVAAMFGHQETVQALLAAGASTSMATPDGLTAASIAREQGFEAVARMIESAGR